MHMCHHLAKCFDVRLNIAAAETIAALLPLPSPVGRVFRAGPVVAPIPSVNGANGPRCVPLRIASHALCLCSSVVHCNASDGILP